MRAVIGRRGWVGLVVAAGLAAGCAAESAKPTTPADTTTAEVGSIPPPRPVERSQTSDPPAKAAEPAKGDVKVSVVRYPALEEGVKKHKDKVVLVDFWATFCGPCVKKFPAVVALHEKYAAKGLVCVSVSLDEPTDSDRVLKFLEGKKASFPNFLIKPTQAEEAQMEKLFNYDSSLPQMALFDRTGKRVWDTNATPLKAKELPDITAELEALVTAQLDKKK